jgi:hypothetical protein
VIGFMSGNQQHPDMMCEVFILGPAISSTQKRFQTPEGSTLAA